MTDEELREIEDELDLYYSSGTISALLAEIRIVRAELNGAHQARSAYERERNESRADVERLIKERSNWEAMAPRAERMLADNLKAARGELTAALATAARCPRCGCDL